jgi:cytochrome subunit of sulfide dehydrogenase
MCKKSLCLVATLWFGLTQAWAQPAKTPPADFQAAIWASSCMACHGTEGKAEGTGMTIGGRTADDLYNSLIAYKTGKRTGTVMNQHARGYSDEQLKRIADQFSRFK